MRQNNIMIFAAMGLFYLMAIFAIRFCQTAERRAQAQMQAQREDAEKTTRMLAAIVESSEEAIIGKTTDGKITSWNTGAEKLLGYNAAEVSGQPVSLLVPPEKVEEEKGVMAEIREGRRVLRLETQRLAKSGERIDVLVTLSPIRDASGATIGVSTMMHDIRARKRADEEIKRHIQALKRSNQELDDFAYIASHDLKEPLRGLTNNAMFLKEDFADRLDETTIRHLDRMTYLCQRLEKLVDDLLYFSRLGRQELATQKTDLNEVIKDIRLMMETNLREANATLEIAKPLPTITCDLPRVTEVFRNLIANAIKYNNSAQKIIEIGCEKPQPGSNDNQAPVFYVRDNGIGIPEQFYNDIFRIFKRLNDESDVTKGTGVGLTFVRKIVERHGGRIWLDSKVGQGTTFYFTLNNKREAQS
jgi:two-component system sensor kinase FixL